MELLIVSFVAGVLTVLAPCILPLLPIIIGGSTAAYRNYRSPFIITASLALSLFIFSLLLKASTVFLGIPPMIWQVISGGIIITFGIVMLFPGLWERAGARLNSNASGLLAKASNQKGWGRDVLVGAALGPVFSSCSPTYALIVATVLPASFGVGLTYLAAYVIGLSAILLLIGLLGQQFVVRLGWASNPRGWFKRAIAVLFIVVGVAVLLGLDKELQALIINNGWYDPIDTFERNLLR